MKKGLKRLISAVLLLCTLMSFVVPASFAEDEGSVVASYNFILDSTIYGTKTTKHLLTGDCECCDKTVNEHLAERYATLGWTYVEDTMTERLYRASVNWGLRLQDTTNKSGWIAYKINVPKSGTFALEYTSSAAETGTYSAYVFAANEIGNGTVAAKMAAGASANLVGTITKSASTTDEFGSWKFKTAGEYVVVLKLENTKQMCLGGLALIDYGTGEVPESSAATESTETTASAPQDRIVETYDFILYNEEQDDGYNAIFNNGQSRRTMANDCLCGCGKTVKEHLATKYNELKWEYLESAMGDSEIQFRSDSGWGLRSSDSNKSGWVAFQITVPEAGEFALEFTSSYAYTGSYNAYIFTADQLATAGSAVNLMAGDVSANAVGRISVAAAGDTARFNSYNFEAIGDYVVVLKHANIQRMYLGALKLIDPADAPEETTAPTETTRPLETTEPTDTTAPSETTQPSLAPDTIANYDFILYNDPDEGYNEIFIKDGALKTVTYYNNCYCGCGKSTQTHLENLYANNRLNWMYLEGTDSVKDLQFRTESKWGLRIQVSDKEGWTAFKIKVPQAGTFNLRYTASAYNNGGTYKAYVLPAAELSGTVADVMAAPDRYELGQITITTDGLVKDFGNYNFQTAGEYIVVLKRVSSARMTLGALALTEATEIAPEKSCSGTYTDLNYNFALYTEDARKAMFDKNGKFSDLRDNHNCVACGKPIFLCIAQQYQAGNLNWTVEGGSFGELTLMGATYQDGKAAGLRMRFALDENGNFIYEEDGKTKAETTDNWTAFRLKVGTPGNYEVKLLKDGNAFNVNVYVIPATKAAYNRAELTAAIKDENLVGNAVANGAMNGASAGMWNFQTAGEYIVIIQAAGSYKRLQLTGIQLAAPKVAEPIPAAKEMLYDFDMVKTDETLIKAGPSTKYELDGKEIRVRELMERKYAAGEVAWKYETPSTDFGSTGSTFRVGGFCFKSDKNYRDRGDVWYSFRIKNPGTATYDIRITTFNAKTALIADIYLIPAPSELTMSEAQIKAAMTDENMLIKGAMLMGEETFYLGDYAFGMAEEYVLVFAMKKGKLLYFSEILMALDGVKADGEIKKETVYNGTVYDFDLADSMNGIFEDSKINLLDVLDTVNARWKSGVSNWNWVANCDRLMGSTAATANKPASTIRFYRASGLRYYMNPDDWTAFRIKSPGEGTFTLSMNYALQASAGTMAVYILPGDTEDIYGALDHSNRVGKIELFNDGSSSVVDGQHSYLGYWDFEAGKEYIVVMEAYEASPFNSAYCYMNFSQLICERGKIDYAATESEKTVLPVMVYDNVVPTADPRVTGLITQVGGHDYYIIPLEGAICLVYDLDTGELISKFNTGISMPNEIIQDENGIVWIAGGTPHLVRYDPFTNTASWTRKTKGIPGLEGNSGYEALCGGKNGDVYLGACNGAILAVYNDNTKEYRVIGNMLPSGGGVHGLVPHGDYLYFAVTNKSTREAVVYKFNMVTEQVEATCDIAHLMTMIDGAGFYVQSVNMLGDGDYIMCGGNSSSMQKPIVIDPDTMELVETNLPTGLNLYVSAPYQGKQYFALSGNYGIYHYDLETKEFGKAVGIPNGLGFRSKGNQLVTLDGEEYLMTFSNTAAAPRLYNINKKEYTNWDNLVVDGDAGAYCRSLTNGPEGSNELYYGAYNTEDCAIYNTETGTITGYYKTGGQGDSSLWYNGKLYYGNYSSTTLNEITLDVITDKLPAGNEVIQRWRLNHEETGQKRVHTLTGGDGYVFAGTIPDTAQYGGAVVVYDTRTGRWFYHRNVVQDQGVIDVEYYDKLLFGSTSTYGGSKAAAKDPNASAKIFVYDYENRQVLATMDPRDYIRGINVPIGYISGLTADPYVEGRFWAVISETLFAFTFDKETLKFKVQEVLSYDKNTYSTSSSRPTNSREIKFNPETKQMYYCFDNVGGFRCIELADFYAPVGSIKVAKTERLTTNWALKYALSEQGDLYYSEGSYGDLWMMPLNVTDEDWAIAGAVDQMILDLGKEITLESEAAIKEARSAYENLSWRYKALIQELDTLRECEVELLERKIETIDPEKITADSLPLMQEYASIYDGMTARQKNYVKNYDNLLEAYNQASILNNERLATALQARIDALEAKFPMTLELEPEVVQLRDDFDAMTAPQRILVDTTLLEKAEAEIKILRVEFVKYVEELIQAIPAEITLNAESAIVAAREAADKLYMTERKEVSYSKLTSAESKLRTLKKAKESAEEVDALIAAIGIVALGDKERIAQAREAFDSLNQTALQFVTKERKLLRAEFILGALQTWGIPAIVVVVVGAGVGVIWFVPSLRKKVFKGKKTEETISE